MRGVGRVCGEGDKERSLENSFMVLLFNMKEITLE